MRQIVFSRESLQSGVSRPTATRIIAQPSAPLKTNRPHLRAVSCEKMYHHAKPFRRPYDEHTSRRVGSAMQSICPAHSINDSHRCLSEFHASSPLSITSPRSNSLYTSSLLFWFSYATNQLQQSISPIDSGNRNSRVFRVFQSVSP
jgi:hypothetical protein